MAKLKVQVRPVLVPNMGVPLLVYDVALEGLTPERVSMSFRTEQEVRALVEGVRSTLMVLGPPQPELEVVWARPPKGE